MAENSLKNNPGALFRVIEGWRYAIFISFYIFSIRLVLISVEHASTKKILILIPILLGVGIFNYIKPLWNLYGFVAMIPLISGIQLLGFMKPMPFLSLIFSSIYLTWLPRRIVQKEEGILPKTRIGNLVDILSGLVLLSLFISLSYFPIDTVFYHFWHVLPASQSDPFFGIEATYVLLQGLIFFRIIELEFYKREGWGKFLIILYLQATMIIIFSFIQLILKIPIPFKGYSINAPFEDGNSYGSYVGGLLFIFLCLLWGGSPKRRLLNGIYSSLIFILAILSYSRATLFVILTLLMVFIIQSLSWKKFLFIVSSFLILFYLADNISVIFYPPAKSQKLSIFSQLMNLEVIKEAYKSRQNMWERAINIVRVFPITGSGIGTYYRISPSYRDVDSKEIGGDVFIENAHNYFLQLSAEVGIPALLIFLSILFGAYRQGYRLLSHVKESTPFIKGLLFGLTAYLLTCLAGHPLVLVTQQFLFWFLISNLTVFPNNLDKKIILKPASQRSLWIFGLFMLFLALGYITSIEKMPNKMQRNEYGFYPFEVINGKRVRWTGKKAVSKIEVKGGKISFEVSAMPHNIGKDGLKFQFYINGKLWDEKHFMKSETKTLQYDIQFSLNEIIEIKTIVDKTFTPCRLGINDDTRELGVTISEIIFLER